MTSVLILEDQYTKQIYEGLHSTFPDYDFPLTDTIKDPMEYRHLFAAADVILLDNYFPSKTGWEEPLGCNVLEYLLLHDSTKKVVCISDYNRKLLTRYDIWQKAYDSGLIHGFTSKDIDKISSLLADIA